MKKTLLCLLCSLAVLLAAVPAFAGTIDTNDQITLDQEPSTAGSFVFTPTGGGAFSLSFSNIFGNASGTGEFIGLNPAHTWYSILQNGASITSGSSCGMNCISLNQSGSIIFNLGSTKNGSDLLTGMLTLVDIQGTAVQGSINNQMLVNLIITGGTLASKFGGMDAVVQLTLIIGSGNLENLTKVLDAKIHSGSVNPLLSEPGTLSLLGFGLLSMGGMVRRTISRMRA